MAEDVCGVELTSSFLERLDVIEAFLTQENAAFVLDSLLAELSATVIPYLACFLRISRRYLDGPPQSANALAQRAMLPTGAAGALREYLHGDCLMLYTAMDAVKTVCLLPVHRQRQLSFDFARLWPGDNTRTKK